VAGLALAFAGKRNGGVPKLYSHFVLFGLLSFSIFASQTAYGQSCDQLFYSDATAVHVGGAPNPVLRIPIPDAVPARDITNHEMMSAPEDVKPILELLAGMDNMSQTDATSVVLGEKRSLLDFLSADDSKNIAVSSPFTVMNAAQRMIAMVYSQGKKTVRLQLTGEPIEMYPFFSSGLPLTNGFRVIGNEKPIAEFVNNLKAQAKGDRSGSSIVLLVGSHGTGKSETLKLLAIAAEKLTSQEDRELAIYTYKWTNLGAIPELHRFLTTNEIDGVKTYADIEAPLGDSPFVLFPPEVQSLIVAKAKKSVEAITDGLAPAPFATADPISQFIRNEIIQHYARIMKRPLTTREIVEKLAEHVEVKRQILGQSYGRMPLIDAQGNDIDVAGLFMSPNPVVRFASGAGPTHVMAWYLNGKVLTSHGNAALFDEWFRNPAEFRDMMLGAFESRRLTVGGAPTVPFDSVMIAATNTANLNDVRSDAKGAAAADRFKITPMRWAVFPGEIAQLQLAMKGSDLQQQDLSVEDAPITKGNIDDLLPRTEGNAKVKTPDHRYRLFFGEGAKKVQVAPHTIMMMAEIIAATRMETDPQKAEKEFSGKILGSNLLRNPIDRLRLFEGLKPEVQADEIRELTEVGVLLKEGESGISARDAGRWLTQAIESAATERTGYTLTPGVVLRTMRTMLNNGSISSASTKERLKWLEIAKEVVAQMLIPRLDMDISRALANGDRVVNEAYFDILDEMYAVHKNEAATTYTSSTNGQERGIDRDRLQQIREIYKKKNGRALSVDQIAIFHSQQRSAGGKSEMTPDESLLDAVAAYYAKINTQVAGFQALVEYERTGIGQDDVKAAHTSLVSALRAMGYNEVAIRDALMLINDQRSRNEAPAP
jgi:predicted Ser/Thr protein kinase